MIVHPGVVATVGTNPSTSIERAFSNRDLFRGPALRSLLWSATASLFLIGGLVALCLLGDLLVTQGRVDADDTLMARIEARETPNAKTVHRGGLLPSVVRSIDAPWGATLAQLYREVPLLQSNRSAFFTLLAACGLFGFLRFAALSRGRTLAARVALNRAGRLRERLHHQALRLGPSDLENDEREHVLGLFTDEVEGIRSAVERRIIAIGRYPVEIAALLSVLLVLNWLLTIQCLIPLALCWIQLERWRRQAEADRRLTADRSRGELHILAEGLEKTRLVRGFNMDEFEQSQFKTHLERFEQNLDTQFRVCRRASWKTAALVIFAILIGVALVGGKVIADNGNAGAMPPASASVFVLALTLLHWPLSALRRVSDSGRLAADKVYRYFNRIPEVGQAVGAKFLDPLSRSLQFEGVSYTDARKRKRLDRFDLKIPANSVTALVSLDPRDALAAAYLLPRFIEPESGRVLIDGEDTAFATLESLRAETLFVGGQEPFLTGSVLQNICCGSDRVSLQQATEAAKAAHAHQFILKLPEGYETMLGEHGVSLTVSQGFQLGLARATLRDPALLVIQEPPPPFETDTKSLLDDTYTRLTAGRTVIFLPTRLSTLRRADQIVVLHAGRVHSTGTHAELVTQCPVYRHWEYLHFNEFQKDAEKA